MATTEGEIVIMEKIYETAAEMWEATVGCGCCAEGYTSFEELSARIIDEYLNNQRGI